MLSINDAQLVILDIQGKLSQIVYQSEQVLKQSSSLVQGCQLLDIPIVWVEQTPEKLGATSPLIAEHLSGESPIAKATFSAYGTEAFVEEVKKNKFKKALICTDKGLLEFGGVSKITDLLDKENLAYEVFSDIQPNPTIENVKDGVEKYKSAGADYIIAIGGGSPMDTAKAVAIIINNPEFSDVRSLEGVADTKNKCVPIIAVATTAGTAAEVTINYVITDVEKDRKFVCVDPHDLPIVAIVDPGMMTSMPKELTAATGLDALTHAIEGFTTKAAWEMTDMFHLKAIELIAKYLRSAVNNEPEGREKMALASYLAGMGFSNVGLGIVHSMAHPLGAFYGTPHGIANAIILPTVMEYNAEFTGEKFKAIAKAFGVKHTRTMSPEEYRKAVEENNLSPIADIKLEKYEDNEDNNETRLYLTESELQEFALDLLNLVREVIFSLKNAIQISENEKQSTLSSEVALIPINYEEVDSEDKL